MPSVYCGLIAVGQICKISKLALPCNFEKGIRIWLTTAVAKPNHSQYRILARTLLINFVLEIQLKLRGPATCL